MENLVTRFRRAAARHLEYRRIVSEIEGLSSREASDLGIDRHDARRIAHSAVYEN